MPPPNLAILLLQMQYPGMTYVESEITRAWLNRHGAEYDSIEFNYRLGDGAEVGEEYTAEIQRMARLLTQKRTDIVARKGDQVELVEVKIRIAFPVIGQLLGYRSLWKLQHPDSRWRGCWLSAGAWSQTWDQSSRNKASTSSAFPARSEGVGVELGQPFNPYRLFHGIFLPEALLSYPNMEPGAKLCYGRLSRYSGKAGECWPAVNTLAKELGVSTRQAKRYCRELEKAQFIRRDPRPGRTNHWVFLWHRVFAFSSEATPPESGGGGVTDMSPQGGHICHPHYIEESHRRESSSSTTGRGGSAKETFVQLYEQHVGQEPTGSMIQGILARLEQKGIDLGAFGEWIQIRLSKRHRRVKPTWFLDEIDRLRTKPGGEGQSNSVRHQVRAHIWGYMQAQRKQRVTPPDAQIVERCVRALSGHTIEELEVFLRERFRAGCLPGEPTGPRSYAWFPKLIENHFHPSQTV